MTTFSQWDFDISLKKRGSSAQQSPAGNSGPFPWECEDGGNPKISKEGAQRKFGSRFGLPGGFHICLTEVWKLGPLFLGKGGSLHRDRARNVGSPHPSPIKFHLFAPKSLRFPGKSGTGNPAGHQVGPKHSWVIFPSFSSAQYPQIPPGARAAQGIGAAINS